MLTSQHSRGTIRAEAAFTVLEVCLAALLLASFATASVYSMIQFNKIASMARLRTLAQSVAQEKMDEIMTVSWTTTGTRPPVLAAGTVTENNIPLNNDALNSASGLSSIYTNNDVQVTATRATTISPVTGNTRLLSATVTLSYSYGNRPYTVTLTGVRATDNF